MTSFRQLSARSPALLIDAASSLVQAAVLLPDGSARWETDTQESGIAIFRCVERLGFNPGEMETFVFCEGPGSILGIRTAAMALRSWLVLRRRPVFAYSSLALVAHALGRPNLGVIADARRDSWHHYQIGHGLRRLPASQLAGEIAMPDHFRHWSPPPAGVETTPYTLADLLPKVQDVDLLHETDAPDAFLHEEPSYVTWTPQIHRAPTA